MLEADDLAATHACLREWEKDIPSRNRSPSLFAFFNSGAHSGASQAHRHLQFLPVAEMKRDQGGDDKWDPLINQMLDNKNAPVDGKAKSRCDIYARADDIQRARRV